MGAYWGCIRGVEGEHVGCISFNSCPARLPILHSSYARAILLASTTVVHTSTQGQSHKIRDVIRCDFETFIRYKTQWSE